MEEWCTTHGNNFVSLIEDQNNREFISEIQLHETDSFSECCGNVRIENNGMKAVHNFNIFPSYGEFRGKRNYFTGTHRIRLLIEKLDINPWFFFGIASNSIKISPSSFENVSSYGWAGNHEVFIGGKMHKRYNGYISDYKEDDVIYLSLDCQNMRIHMLNVRSKQSSTIVVDIEECRLPWRLQINLFHIQTRIRII